MYPLQMKLSNTNLMVFVANTIICNWTRYRKSLPKSYPHIFINIIFLHGLGRLTCSGIDTLPSFTRASAISSSSGFVGEDVFRESGVVHSFKVVDSVLFVFESHVLYSRDI